MVRSCRNGVRLARADIATLPYLEAMSRQCNALLLAAGAANGRGKPDARAAVLEFSRAVSDILATEEPG